MEKHLKISAKDGLDLHAVHNTATKQPGNKLVIFAHGLTGKSASYVHMAGSIAARELGYDTLRLDFYPHKPHARRLSISTLQTHCDDIQSWIEHFRYQYEKIYMVGHSYGALAMLIANPDIHAMSLWDATFAPHILWELLDPRYSQELDACLIDLGCEYIIGKDMIEEAQIYTVDKCLELASQVKAPTQLVIAECDSCSDEEIYFDKTLPHPTEKVIIPNASHTFTEEGVADVLFEHTFSWFGQFEDKIPVH